MTKITFYRFTFTFIHFYLEHFNITDLCI